MRESFVVTEGVAYAPAVIFKNIEIDICKTSITQELVESEISLYKNALEHTYRIFQEELKNTDSEQAKEFLDTACLYLTDPYIKKQIEQSISDELVTAEFSIINCYHNYISNLISMNDPFVMHNEFEIRNLAETLVLELHKKKVVLPTIEKDSILICNNITPAQFLTLNLKHIKGVLLEDGNTNSHMAIVLRSLKIPAIFNVNNATKHISNSTPVLVDAYNNRIFIDPLDEIVWTTIQKSKELVKKQSKNIVPLIAQYKMAPDGERMRVLANVGSLTELNKLVDLPSSGIGLFRTEFLFMDYPHEPTEEEQYEIYKKIMCSLPNKYSVTFRTFDFNADKLPLYMTNQPAFTTASSLGSSTSSNTRHLLDNQISALLKASEFGSMNIMFPMVTEYEEVKELVDLFNNTKDKLIKEGHKINDIKLGIMIETPAGAIMSDELAKLVDFFSIGTNDLTQYTEACSREIATKRNDELSPAVLKLIRLTVENARKNQIPVCICGELVHNINYLAIFVNIGIRDFSVAPFYLNKVLDSLHTTDFINDIHIKDKISLIKTKKEILELNNTLIANIK